MANFVDRVLDVETSGLLSQHSTRAKIAPPHITQFGYIAINPGDPTKYKPLLGQGPGGGYTDRLGPIIDKYKPLSPDKIPPAMWREIAAKGGYDPSVLQKGSVLNDQVRRHVQTYIDAKASGNIGAFRSASEYIAFIKNDIQHQINIGNTVRLHAQNKGFDVTMMMEELRGENPKEHRAFVDWIRRNMDSAKKGNPGLVLRGIEENIHEAMFNVMMKDSTVMPRFATSGYFEKAAQAGLKTVGIEASSPHYALRTFVDDIVAIQAGGDPDQILKGLPANLRKEVAAVKDYSSFAALQEKMFFGEVDERLVMGHFNAKAAAKHGQSMGSHVKSLGLQHVSGWKQDDIMKLLKSGKASHAALQDAMDAWANHLATTDPKAAQKLAMTILTDESLINERFASKYAQYLQDHAQAGLSKQPAVNALMKIAHTKAKSIPRAAASRLARSPLTLPIVAAAGGLILADHLSAHGEIQRVTKGMSQMMAGKLEGLRKSVGQWDNTAGINTSYMNFNIESDFGSGRWDQVWGEGSYKGVPIDPFIYQQRQLLAMSPEIAQEEAMQNLRSSAPTPYGPTRQELADQRLDLSNYIYELEDADSIILHKAWLNTKVPVVGPVIGFLQKHLMNLVRTVSGQEMGFQVRVSGLDAPEVEHDYGANWTGSQRFGEEATGLMDQLMGGSAMQRLMGGRATHIKLLPGETYGRYIGIPYAAGSDIGAELVRGGGAIALSMKGSPSPYEGMEQVATSRGEGMWQYPEYAAIPEARRRNIRPIMSHLQKRTIMSSSLEAAATRSLMTYAMNPQMHGVRDQQAQNLYSRGY